MGALTRLMRGPGIVAAGIAVLALGAWWGIVRDGGDAARPAGGGANGGSEPVALDGALDHVPGCRIDTCHLIGQRQGFRHDGEPAALILVALAESCEGAPATGLHLFGPGGVAWSAPESFCGDPRDGIETDRTGHAFLTFPGQGSSWQLVVLRIRSDAVTDFGSLEGRFTGQRIDARDVDGDGVFELAVDGREFHWRGGDYVER